ncbi:hypothetical protein Q4Q39_19855 [Flavivirga amylovorans]|uniref:Lipocalin-like domain-containing protein n=1 Tax=Flavivirga amylovorans TaxID=870486 RepID=A0ABT8X7X3_9FLAO|nr:hypothetical protein [Flavivirga amylovorans]MDO5989665.1 hypothetical protein [Flavivirga amylovorans]
MNKLLFILCFALFITSCSSEDDGDMSVVGTWKLTAWDVVGGFDINNDGTTNTNILDEIECENNETLTFDVNNVVASNKTFNPDVNIALQEGTTDKYMFNVACDEEGIIGLATSYSQNLDIVLFNGIESTVIGNQLFRLMKGSIKIYNEDFTEIITTRDVTFVYTRQ